MKAKCPIGALPLQAAAKELAARGIDTGGHKIFDQLRGLGMLNGLHPTMRAENMGWLVEKQGDWSQRGRRLAYSRVFITTSGIDQVEFELRQTERRLRNSASSLRLDAVKIEPPVEVHECELGISNVNFGF